MSVAQKLERLARIIPGVAGYQDREASRETDKFIRLKLTAELGRIKREMEEDKRQLMEKKELVLLPLLDRVASKLDKIGYLVQYTGRGYRGIFDLYKLDQKKLDRLYSFDLGLFDGLEEIKAQGERLRVLHGNRDELKKAAEQLDRALDQFEKNFTKRQDILTTV